MMRSATLIAVAAMLVFTCLSASVSAGTTDEQKCGASKLKELGKYKSCRLKANSRAAKTGELPDFSKCNAKFALKWAAIEAKYGAECPTLGDAVGMQFQAAVCTDAQAAAVAP